MSPVAQLRRSQTTQLVTTGETPQPVAPSALHASIADSAAVLHPHPTSSTPAATAPMTASTSVMGKLDDSQDQRPGTTRAVADLEDAEITARISGIARSVAQGALEVLAGSRPLQQMARWLDPENYERLHLRSNLVRCINTASNADRIGTASAHRHVVVRSARVCPVRAGVYEASVVAFDQKRVRAVALRIEQRRGAWRVTALEIG